MYGEEASFRSGGIEGGGRPYDLTTHCRFEIDQYEDKLLLRATSISLIHVGTSEPHIRLLTLFNNPIQQHNSPMFGVNVGIARADNAQVTCEEQWHFVAIKPHRSMCEMWCRERVESTLALNDTNSHQ